MGNICRRFTAVLPDHLRAWLPHLSIALLAIFGGFNAGIPLLQLRLATASEDNQTLSSNSVTDVRIARAKGNATAHQTLAEKKPLPLQPRRPRVALSGEHLATCKKLVGEAIPPLTITSCDGKQSAFHDILSDQLTVLIFWNEQSVMAMEQFQRIPVEILDTFARYRVKVVAAHVGGTPARTRFLTGDYGDKIVSLVDENAEFFGQVAHSRIPRTYLLDQEGKILWLDVEYSQSTVRSLSNALAYFLTTKD